MASLRARLIAVLLVTALFPLAILSYAGNRILQHTLMDTARQNLFSTAAQTADDMDQFLASCLDDIRTEAQLPSLREFLLQDSGAVEQKRLLEELNALSRKDFLFVESYGLLDAHGINRMDTRLSLLGHDESQMPYFTEPLKKPRAFVSPEIILQKKDEGANLFLSAPVMDSENKVLGMLRVQYKALVLQKRISENAEQAGQGIRMLLVDQDRIVLACSDQPQAVYTLLETSDPLITERLVAAGRIDREGKNSLRSNGIPTGIRAALKTPFFTFTEQQNIFAAVAVPMTRCPWTIVMAKPMDSLLQPVNDQLRQSLIMVGLMSVIVILIGFLFGTLLTRPIRQLRHVADRLASGDLAARARVEGEVESKALSLTFNRMAERLQETIQQLHHLVETLQALGEEREGLIRELELRNREWEGVLYATSHDLRSPLVNIQGFSNRLEKSVNELYHLYATEPDKAISPRIGELLSGRIPKALHFIQVSAEKMDTLISGLLKLSRTGRAQMRNEKVDMDALIDRVLCAMEFQLQGIGATILREPLPFCRGDKPQLEQVFSNLLDNAVKYRDPIRPLEICLSGKVLSGQVVYSVRDTGRGIDSVHHERIWDVFHRIDPEHSVPGEGLGLALTRRIIERHSGRIWVESELGKGSCFYVEIPEKDGPFLERIPDTGNGLTDGL